MSTIGYYICVPFAWVLRTFYELTGSYGWALVLFTIVVKLITLPFQMKSKKSMMRMNLFQPKIKEIQTKYANNPQKMNDEIQMLYAKEGVNPMSGCLPMILSMAILIIMFNAMRMVANNELASQCLELLTTGVQTNESWLWVKNIWMPDSPFHPIIADSSSLRMIPADVWAKVFAAQSADAISKLAALGIDANTISGDTVFAALQALPTYASEVALWPTLPTLNLLITRLSIYSHNNGWFILPLLACVTQFLMTASQPQQPTAQGQPDTGKFMKYFFPFFTLFICSGYNAAFALYWVVSNIYGWVESIVFNKVLEKQDAASAAAVKEDSVK